MIIGEFCEVYPPHIDGVGMVVRAYCEELTKAGADVAARVVPGGQHCEACWEERIPVFFDYLLG